MRRSAADFHYSTAVPALTAASRKLFKDGERNLYINFLIFPLLQLEMLLSVGSLLPKTKRTVSVSFASDHIGFSNICVISYSTPFKPNTYI